MKYQTKSIIEDLMDYEKELEAYIKKLPEGKDKEDADWLLYRIKMAKGQAVLFNVSLNSKKATHETD